NKLAFQTADGRAFRICKGALTEIGAIRSGTAAETSRVEFASVPAAAALARRISRRLDRARYRRRHHARRLRHSCVAGLCGPGGPAAADRDLRLFARRS